MPQREVKCKSVLEAIGMASRSGSSERRVTVHMHESIRSQVQKFSDAYGLYPANALRALLILGIVMWEEKEGCREEATKP